MLINSQSMTLVLALHYVFCCITHLQVHHVLHSTILCSWSRTNTVHLQTDIYPQNLEEQFSKNGYLYEQYDDTNGQGSGSHPFNGWTALVALIAVEA